METLELMLPAAMPTPTPEEIMAELIPQLIGATSARYAGIAAFVVLSYDHFLTLDDEFRFFWSGEWSMSRVLFFSNRYFPHLAILWGIVCFVAPGLSPEFCTRSIHAVLVLRIWYLYRHSTLARALAMFCFVACAMACVMTLYFTGEEIKGIDINATYKLDLDIVGCIVTPPRDLWKVFAPVLVLHTILYLFTAYRGLHHRSVVAEPAPVMARLVRDGGVLYFVVLVSVGFASIGSAIKSSPSIQLLSVFSNMMLALTSTSISRIMLSIRCLTADLISDPTSLILNNNELSRVSWRKGPNAGDIIVDVDGRTRRERAGMVMQIGYDQEIQDVGLGSESWIDMEDRKSGAA
ncbi:hypothetical protein HWV62_17048 [Athelia sp. TMB]|nr:hypothetical protein HWV62_17048 [Athelia sp. TMB]